ncbi:Ribosome maturation factor RimM like [Actinidia chinensis var. chinensis]|uniref:Ribosome maturation factor RimM like n=1 Tax=Actinidia chinensis var. chinensis TaxID=1590841 RepID=A0A2R6Q6T5_ACTCC|nr:Ribosome maturation factor RimM like [Actinidia chinensis var. chinensis]
MVETSKAEPGYVEIGYISGVHGLQGEVRVKPITGFPELRFSKPGRRWLRQQVSGRDTIQEIELLDGRGHPGQKCWIVKFSNINTVDQAQLLIGSTILVTEEDKPELEECEFYSHDLVGMKVILKETGEPVGTVVNIYNSGASDLLHVMLNSSTAERPNSETDASGPLVWVPFVEAIVPDVDVNKREMLITPPKGLLELNIPSHERSKKERRQLEWKERKKFQQRVIAAKKKLCEMEQQHVFHGFRFGEKEQRSLLADQIVGVKSKLLQQALPNIEVHSKRWNLHEFIGMSLAKNVRTTLRISEEFLSDSGCGEKFNASSEFQEKGHLLTSEGKVAIVLYMDHFQREGSGFAPDLVDRAEDSSCLLVDAFFQNNQGFFKIEDRASVPLILVCPAHEIHSLENSFTNHNHFGFDSEKVWFLEEEKLPVISNSLEEQTKHKILMKSPWEILQTPVGSGGVFSLLSSGNILEKLSEMGIEYIEVCGVNLRHVGGYTLLGLVSSCAANIGIQIGKDMNDLEDNFDVVFSMKFMKHLTKQTNKLGFHAIPKPNPHVEKVDKEWVDVVPSSPNSYELRRTIYSSLSACPPDKVCLMEVTG